MRLGLQAAGAPPEPIPVDGGDVVLADVILGLDAALYPPAGETDPRPVAGADGIDGLLVEDDVVAAAGPEGIDAVLQLTGDVPGKGQAHAQVDGAPVEIVDDVGGDCELLRTGGVVFGLVVEYEGALPLDAPVAEVVAETKVDVREGANSSRKATVSSES